MHSFAHSPIVKLFVCRRINDNQCLLPSNALNGRGPICKMICLTKDNLTLENIFCSNLAFRRVADVIWVSCLQQINMKVKCSHSSFPLYSPVLILNHNTRIERPEALYFKGKERNCYCVEKIVARDILDTIFQFSAHHTVRSHLTDVTNIRKGQSQSSRHFRQPEKSTGGQGDRDTIMVCSCYGK